MYDQSSAYPQTYAASDRSGFIVKTYLHLLGAILLFVALEVGIFASGLALPMAQAMLGTSWLLVLGAFMVVSWIGSRVAQTAESKIAQYAALALYVVAEAIIFVPMLLVANMQADGVITSAAAVTLMGFGGLTAVAFITRKDFSFLRGVLMWASFGVLLLIVSGVIFGFQLGTFFSVGMVVFAGAAILYDTSNIIHHYPENRYVGAALALFASVALLFWYILRIFMSRD